MRVRLKRPEAALRIIATTLLLAGSFTVATHHEHDRKTTSLIMGTVGSGDISAHFARQAEEANTARLAAEQQRALHEDEVARLARTARASRGAHRSAIASSESIWWALGNCESHNTNDHWPPYYGWFQFSEETWHGIGETGLPDEFPYEVQLAAAKRLQARSGWRQWPVCSRKLSLR